MADAKTVLSIEATINAPIEKVWKYWNEADHVKQWNAAIDSWHCPAASNDFRVGGTFSYTMAAKDGSFSFDFGGVYDKIEDHRYIEYTMGDGRKVKNTFTAQGDKTHIKSDFEAETQNSLEMQQGGWQSILNNFKTYTEKN